MVPSHRPGMPRPERLRPVLQGGRKKRKDLKQARKRQKEVGGFIHQQDCMLLGSVVGEEGPDPMLEEG